MAVEAQADALDEGDIRRIRHNDHYNCDAFSLFFVNPSSWPAVQKYLHSVSSSARQSTAKDLSFEWFDLIRCSPR